MKNNANKFNSKVFRRALALGGHIETDNDGRPVVIVPEHAIEEFKKWMAKHE